MNRNLDQSILSRAEPSETIAPMNTRSRYYWFKNMFDFGFALLALVFLSPLMGFIALLILIDSRGPVLFIQKRIGTRLVKVGEEYDWQQQEFPCYKFRTMRQDADPSLHQAFMKAFIKNDREDLHVLQEGDDHILKLVRDPRVTRFGHFLRKFSLDELPQLFNVMRGELSIVGPRPAIPYELESYQPWHFMRLQAKQGLTGLWQVEARSSANFDEMISLDIQYIQNQSFWLDLKILLKTPLAVLSCKGAY